MSLHQRTVSAAAVSVYDLQVRVGHALAGEAGVCVAGKVAVVGSAGQPSGGEREEGKRVER